MAGAQGLILADDRQVGGSFGELFEPSENTRHHLSDLLERATIVDVDVDVVRRREWAAERVGSAVKRSMIRCASATAGEAFARPRQDVISRRG